MNACNDFIQFDNSSDWERVISVTFTAVPVGQNSYIPIGQRDLGVAITEPYVVIVVQAVNAKQTWRYGGEVRQTWYFDSGAAIGSTFSAAQSKPTQLFLNKPQVIALNRNTTDTFRLYYDPPTWFKQVIVIGWKYVGKVENFISDTLFDLGNKVGIGTLNDPNSITNLLAAQQALLEDIENRLISIENNSSNGGLNPIPDTSIQVIKDSVSSEVASVSQNVKELSNNLGNVLSGNVEPSVLKNNYDPTSIEDELT